ncbi:MAG: helix-turn-helix domain-containing protein [Saprospiraceae bacterium]
MQLQMLRPRPELAPYVDKFWLFESAIGVPTTDNRVIAPNGRAKIILPFQNALSTIQHGIHQDYPEQEPLLIGIWEEPVVLSSPERPTGTIGMELNPRGLYRFLNISLHELSNQILSFETIFGAKGRFIHQKLMDLEQPEQKIEALQLFLIERLQETDRQNHIIDFSVQHILSTHGLLEIKALEKKTGYSKRYLDLLFKEHIGISPKTFASITRFQQFYQRWANAAHTDFFREVLYDLYYDQSHFIKEFKRYTGYAPAQYARAKNDFGKMFYKNK